MLLSRFRRAGAFLRFVLKPAIAFEFWSTLIFMISLVPASGWLLNRLVAASGQYAVSDNDLFAFFLSTPGIIFLLSSVGFILAFWFSEQVGLLIICLNAVCKKKVSVCRVLLEQVKHLPSLFGLGLLQAAVFLAAAVPFILGIRLTYLLLLRKWDLYYYLNVKPLSWWIAVAVVGLLLVVYLSLAVWLYSRWLLSIPILISESTTPTGALKKSWRQTRGRFWEFVLPLVICWVGIFLFFLAINELIRAAAAQLLAPADLALKVVVPVVVGSLVFMTVLDAVGFIIGKIAHVLLITDFFIERSDGYQKPSAPTTSLLSPKALKRLGWIVAAVFLILGGAGGAAFIQGININRSIEITGHRGSKLRAPENSLSALEQAIAEGADYAEIDVQTTADGEVVLLHDADLMRVASVRRRLRDINYNELNNIDIGSWFAPEFSSERIPTLKEAIEVARDRIKLNIELKFTWPDPTLTRKVGSIIRQSGFASECVVSSLNFNALAEIKGEFPELKTGFIVFQAAGSLSKMEADFLSINAARATPGLVRRLHNRGRAVHVWTVNDLNNLTSMIEMGVDNIITDYPREVRRFLEAWNALSDAEKIALMLRNLIVGMERPQPSEL